MRDRISKVVYRVSHWCHQPMRSALDEHIKGLAWILMQEIGWPLVHKMWRKDKRSMY